MLVAKLRGDKLNKAAEARMKSGVALNPALKSAQAGRTAEKIAAEAKVGRDKARAAIHLLNNGKAGIVDDVIAGKKRLASVKPKAKPRKARKVLTFEDEVWRRFGRFITHWPITKHREVKREVVTFLLGRYDRKTDRMIVPVSVRYPDGSIREIREIFEKKWQTATPVKCA